MDDHIITIGDSNGFDGWKWKMTVDLKELAEATGRKDKKTKLIEIPLNRAKKLLKLIRQHSYRNDQMKRFVVISQMTSRGPEYRIYDRINEATVEGGFDTQRWAESIADILEEKYGKDKSDNQASGRAVRSRRKHKQHSEEPAEDSGRADRDGEGDG